MVVSVYVCCAVSAMLRIQLSVLGGGLFLQHRDQVDHMTRLFSHVTSSLPPSSVVVIVPQFRGSTWPQYSTSLEKVGQFVTCTQSAVCPGLQQLVTQVCQATERVLVSYSLKHQLTAEGVVQLLTEIRSLSASRGPASAG